MDGRRELYMPANRRQFQGIMMELSGLQRRENAFARAAAESRGHFGQRQIGQDYSTSAEERLIERIALRLLDEELDECAGVEIERIDPGRFFLPYSQAVVPIVDHRL
jgi:hypothetical protein